MTALPVVAPPWPVEVPPLGVDGTPLRLGELMPVTTRTPEQKALELERIARIEGQIAAYKVEVAASFARDRTHGTDRRAGTPGAASPEWAPHGTRTGWRG